MAADAKTVPALVAEVASRVSVHSPVTDEMGQSSYEHRSGTIGHHQR